MGEKPREFYTVAEFANIIRVSRSTVERWITEGNLRFWQMEGGGIIRIPATEVDRHLQPEKK